VREARRELLGRIADFTLKHDLAVTGGNLALVCNALSGSDARAAQAILAREIRGETIDQDWLDGIAQGDAAGGPRLAELDLLMDRLETTMIQFGQTARSAADETQDHKGAIDAQITAMGESCAAGASGHAVSRVIELSRAMLESIAQVHGAMLRSQAETEALRDNLAKAREEADIDPLTRLPNRRAFERRLASADAEARRTGTPLCVAFCDIDRFKDVNDTHGHDAGDRVLCAVGSTLGSLIERDCFVARHGGEEFVVLFPGLDKQEAFEKLEGVRRAMATRQLHNRETGRPFGRVTFSGGIAEVTETEEPRSALARADAALYEAKQAGRNRIHIN
jgi:diguanylate cyclase